MTTNTNRYHGYRFPPEVISHAVWLYHRFCQSFRDVEDLLAKRGIVVTHETVRQWCRKFGPNYARKLRRRRDACAAKRFFLKLLKGQGGEPRWLITDKLRSYSAAHRSVMPSVAHDTRCYANNRAEVSHQPTRQRERQMRGSKSPGQAQRFLAVHGVVQNFFRVGRHRLRSANYRLLRGRACLAWNAVTGT